jgi:hypothetical protein
MKPERRMIADEIYASGREFDAQQSNRLARLRNLEPETAELLAVLIRAARARRILQRVLDVVAGRRRGDHRRSRRVVGHRPAAL